MRTESRTWCRFVRTASFCALVAITQCSVAQESSPVLGFEPGKGLTSLSWRGVNILGRGLRVLKQTPLETLGGETVETDLSCSVEVDETNRRCAYTYSWCRVEETFRLNGNRVDVAITIANPTDDLILKGVAVHALEFQFPETPADWPNHHSRLGFGVGQPTIAHADFGSGKVVMVNELFEQPVLFGLLWGPPPHKRLPLMLVTSRKEWYPNNFRHAWRNFELRPILPGQSDTFRYSLRFAPSGTATEDMVADVYERYRNLYPHQLDWPDRRPIGSLFLSSSGSGRVVSKAKYPTNPRGWHVGPPPGRIDVTTDAGLERFREALLAKGRESIKTLKAADAQGVIVWDIEGQEFPHATSYLGDPRWLPPEMDAASDEFFKLFTDAGLRVGVCLRSQMPVSRGYEENLSQHYFRDPERRIKNLIEKVGTAKQRWGCTLFYVDSNGDPGAPLAVEAMRRVQRAHPDVLLIPEHEQPGYYGCTAPYHGLGHSKLTMTPPRHLSIYPRGFSVIAISHHQELAMGEYRERLQAGIRRGDVMMFHCWYRPDFAQSLKQWYDEFGQMVPPDEEETR